MVTVINDDLFAPDVVKDPYPYFARLREEDPIHWNQLYELWVITTYKDVVWVTRRPEYFSSAVEERDPRGPYPAINESDLGLYQVMKDFFAQWFIRHDPPEHTEMRKVVHSYFTPKATERWRPLVVAAVKELLDEAQEVGAADAMRDFAVPLPLLIIARIMGMPKQDRASIRALAEKIIFLSRGEADRMKPLTDGIKGLQDYIRPMVDDRVKHPGDDLLSVLARGEKQGIYSRDEVVANAILLLFAGHETTINLICNAILSFMRNPDQWKLLTQDPAGRVKRATEECLRYDSPVRSMQRVAAQDVELNGRLIHKNDRMRWFMSSANRDPAMFDNPDKFDILRYPNPHVAFGSGIHQCLGSALARLEGQEVLKALAQRFPGLYLQIGEDEVEYDASLTFRSVKVLPVSWK